MRYNYKENPSILRSKRKSNGVCPFTQWYCARTCALAVSNGRHIDEWRCGLTMDVNNSQWISYIDNDEDNN